MNKKGKSLALVNKMRSRLRLRKRLQDVKNRENELAEALVKTYKDSAKVTHRLSRLRDLRGCTKLLRVMFDVPYFQEGYENTKYKAAQMFGEELLKTGCIVCTKEPLYGLRGTRYTYSVDIVDTEKLSSMLRCGE